jgi:hypothetical protein
MASNISSGDGGLFFRFVNNDTGSSSETTMAEDSISTTVDFEGSTFTQNIGSTAIQHQVNSGDGYVLTQKMDFEGITLDYTEPEVLTNSLKVSNTGINIQGLPSFDDDAAASGLTTGDLYITTGDGAAPLNVAGIVMMKL